MRRLISLTHKGNFSILPPRKSKLLSTFVARAEGPALSISVNKLGENLDLSQAAPGYVGVPKQTGNGKAKLEKVTETKLPDGTPAAGFVIKWSTKNNVPLTTQALTVYRDGYSVSMGTHTWARGNCRIRRSLTLSNSNEIV